MNTSAEQPNNESVTTAAKPAFRVQSMTLIAVMTAVMCIFGPMTVPVGPVPVSLTILTIWLSVYILGMKKGTSAVLVYILLGLAGLPVLSGYSGGPQKLVGPTGGYIVAWIPMALISGYFIDRFRQKVWLQIIGMVAGLAVCYLAGTIWLSIAAGMGFRSALMAGVIPFIGLDLVKLVIAVVLGKAIRSRMRSILK